MDKLLIGIKGHAVCLDKKSGEKIWETMLKSTSSITNICVDGEDVFAYSGGHLFCLELASGKVKWENKLAGFGYGPCIIAMQGQNPAVVSSHGADQQNAAATAAVAAAAASTAATS